MKEQQTEKHSRVIWYDLLKIAAVCAVMILHIASYRKNITDIHTFLWAGKNFFNGFSRWGVGVFVMISGALFLSRDIPLKKLYGKYILRIALSFIFWSFLYSLVFNLIEKHSVKAFISGFIQGHNHLWFLYMIAGLYMIVPFLRKIVLNEKLTLYFLLLSFVFAFVIPETVTLLKIFSPEYSEVVQGIINRAHIHFVLGFSFYFVLGYYLSTANLSNKLETLLLVFGMLGLFITVFGNYAISFFQNKSGEYIFGNNTVNVALQVSGVFVLFKKLFGKASLSERKEKIIVSLSKYSFGAYLVHYGIITVINKLFRFNADTFNPLLSVPLVFMIVCVSSFAVSAVLNHSPFVKKYLV